MATLFNLAQVHAYSKSAQTLPSKIPAMYASLVQSDAVSVHHTINAVLAAVRMSFSQPNLYAQLPLVIMDRTPMPQMCASHVPTIAAHAVVPQFVFLVSLPTP